MTAARTAYLALSAVLMIAALTAIGTLLGVPEQHPLRAADLTICRAGDPPQDCYPERA